MLGPKIASGADREDRQHVIAKGRKPRRPDDCDEFDRYQIGADILNRRRQPV